MTTNQSSNLLPCPFCGAMPIGHDDRYMCSTPGCVMQEDTISAENWNTRPIEDDLRKRIAELEKDNDEFRQLIRDWSIVLEQDDHFQLWQVESVRQAMLEINKEREE